MQSKKWPIFKELAYDISDPKRLARVARVCEDFGVRVQYSVFECRLEETEFTDFWLRLLEEIRVDQDRIVACKIDARCAKEAEPNAKDGPVEER